MKKKKKVYFLVVTGLFSWFMFLFCNIRFTMCDWEGFFFERKGTSVIYYCVHVSKVVGNKGFGSFCQRKFVQTKYENRK